MRVNDYIFSQAQSAKLLTVQDELDLFTKVKAGDRDAIDQIFKSHLRLVISIARKYSNYNVDIDDLIQIGSVGLVNAIRSFDPNHGVQFASYAKQYIRGDILHNAYNYGSIIKTVTTKAHIKLFFNLKKHMELGKKLSSKQISEIAELYNVSEADVVEMESRLTTVVYSVDVDDDPEMWDKITKPTESPERAIIEEERRELVHKRLSDVISSMDSRSQIIMKSRYLSEDPKPLRELSDEFGVSIARVGQLEKRAVQMVSEKMRKFVA